MKKIAVLLSLLLLAFCAGCSNNSEEALALTPDPVLSESRYTLGDKMGDYTITDVNGVSHSFSEILAEKKAIVLNFWFINCGPCRIEFPYMNEAYESLKADIEILAINPTGESEEDINAFSEEMGLTFPVAVGDLEWNNAFYIQGFPTTVVIDRTGTISFMHTGYIDSTETFMDIFEFFISEDYTPTVVKNISDIK